MTQVDRPMSPPAVEQPTTGVGAGAARSDVGDPDPTPTATPWEEYLAAAQALDAVRREAAATTTAEEVAYAVGAAQAEVDQLRRRLELQRARLIGEAVRAGLPAPELLPTPAEQAAAATALAGDPAGALPVLRRCHGLLDACDAQLNAAPAARRRGLRPPGSLVVVMIAMVAAAAAFACLALVLAVR